MTKNDLHLVSETEIEARQTSSFLLGLLMGVLVSYLAVTLAGHNL